MGMTGRPPQPSVGVADRHGLGSWLGVTFDVSMLAMLVLDGSERIVAANRAAVELLSVDRLVGLPMTDVGSGKPAGWWLTTGPERSERIADLRTGSGKPLRVAVRCDTMVPSGGSLVLCQLCDITAETRGQRVADEELSYRWLADNLPGLSVVLFDRDLRLTVVAGQQPSAATDPDEEPGTGAAASPSQGVEALQLLQPRYSSILAGGSADFHYDSISLGRQFRVRTRPVTDPAGTIIGGVIVTEDVTAEQSRTAELEQIHELAQLGGCRYDRQSGWSFDASLLALWGLDAGGRSGFPAQLVPAQERDAASSAWAADLATSGRHAFSYRIRHGRTGELRHLHGRIVAVTAPDGSLVRAVASHVDVTDSILAHQAADRVQTAALHERVRLVRRVGDALNSSAFNTADPLASIANLASALLGDGAAIRVLLPQSNDIENRTRHREPSR